MGSYEISLLVGSTFGILALLALASMLLDQGSSRIFILFALISSGGLYLANVHGEAGVNFNDLPPILYSLVGNWVRDT